MSISFGGSSSTRRERGTALQTVSLPPPSATQEELGRLQLEIARLQEGELRSAGQERAAYAASPQAALQGQVELKALQNLQARLTGQAPVLSPEEERYLNTIYSTASRRGEADLTRFGEGMAAARGMNVTDSPIGGELLRQRRELGEGLESARAESALNLGSAGAQFSSQMATFGEQLRQQAFQNRLALAGLTPGFTSYAGLESAERRSSPIRFDRRRGLTTGSGLEYGASYGGQSGGWGSFLGSFGNG